MPSRPTTMAAIVAALISAACGDATGQASADITNVPQSEVERQTIGNCWLYAKAAWVESMHLAATGQELDVSQSYWTYWHWFDQIPDLDDGELIQEGGNGEIAHEIIRRRGLVAETQFVPEDVNAELSYAQLQARDKMNDELYRGRLITSEARNDPRLVRRVLDEAWGLSQPVKEHLDIVFGYDAARTFEDSASPGSTPIFSPHELRVRYTMLDDDETHVRDTSLIEAIDSWHWEHYPSWGVFASTEEKRRDLLIRVQRALHDGQPVELGWNVDFSALDRRPGFEGAFTLEARVAGKPGDQGAHATILTDYEAETADGRIVHAGETADPATLGELLDPETRIIFLRIKNSWGTFKPPEWYAPSLPGYNDLYIDYLDTPMPWCPESARKTTNNCEDEVVPFNDVFLPPGY